MGSCLDLRQYQDDPNMAAIMGKLLSGKSGYKAVIEKRKEVVKCPQCAKVLEGVEKFCPECGTQTEIHYKKESKAVHISNILEENNLDEELIYKYEDCDYYRPNSSKYCLSRGYSFIFDNKFDFVGFINRYKEENKELIKVLEANFDFVNIYVGYQSYWS